MGCIKFTSKFDKGAEDPRENSTTSDLDEIQNIFTK